MDTRLVRNEIGFLTVSEKPNPADLKKYYSEKYFQLGLGSYDTMYTADEISYFESKLSQRYAVLQCHMSRIGRMLDVGCGEGFALSFYRRKGWSVRGLDFSSAGVATQNPSCIDVLVTGDVFELLKNEIDCGCAYDVILLQNVIEHVIDPVNLIHSLKKLLEKDGVLVVTAPNDYSITQQAALNNGHIDQEYWVSIPDHLNYFDAMTLPDTFRQLGYLCLELLGDFPVDWFLFHPGSNYITDKKNGRFAHHARVQIENYINQLPVEDVNRFWSYAAKLGLGRDLTAFFKRADA